MILVDANDLMYAAGARHRLKRPSADLHAAACRVYGAEAICSWDRDFDRFEGVKRVEPGEVG